MGTIGSWFDWELVIALAKSSPKIEFRLIGPVYVRSPALPHNVRLEQALPHTEALHAMTQFNVGLIPFMRNALTACVDPIKYYEYRAGVCRCSVQRLEKWRRDEDAMAST